MLFGQKPCGFGNSFGLWEHVVQSSNSQISVGAKYLLPPTSEHGNAHPMFKREENGNDKKVVYPIGTLPFCYL